MPVSDTFLSVCIPCKAWCCTQKLPPVTNKEKDAIITAGFPDYFLKKEDDLYCIQPNENGQCPFLQDDLSCTIHTVKPLLCKVWPVIPRFKQGKREYIVMKCPLFPQLSEDDLENAKEQANHVPLHIIKNLWTLSEEMKQQYKRFQYEKI